MTESGQPIFLLITRHFGWGYAVMYCVMMFIMTFGLFNVIAALYVENTVAAAKYNNLHTKRQRLLDAEYFADKATALVEFVWRIHRSRCSQRSRASELDGTLTQWDSSVVDDILALQITPELFDSLREFRGFQDILNDMDVSDEDQ